jgi:hypothetical protein
MTPYVNPAAGKNGRSHCTFYACGCVITGRRKYSDNKVYTFRAAYRIIRGCSVITGTKHHYCQMVYHSVLILVTMPSTYTQYVFYQHGGLKHTADMAPM